jgi:hypothetical protein
MTMRQLVPMLVLALSVAVGARSQAPATTADVARLQTTANEIGRQVEVLKKTDAALSAEVLNSLADLDKEITYLMVKMRREGAITRQEYGEIRDRLDALRVKASGQRVSAQPMPGGPETVMSVPIGTEIEVRLQTALSSGMAKVEQRFEATTILDYTEKGQVILPAGSLVRGFVSSVRAAGLIDRKGSLTLSFDEVRARERIYRLRASVIQALDGKMARDDARAAAGTAVGGLTGGGKGALVGVLVGAGGTLAATEGADVDLPLGTILRIRLNQALTAGTAGTTGTTGTTGTAGTPGYAWTSRVLRMYEPRCAY